ncbi:fused response regulator/phosphatase [Pleionea sp. CnH1-48]|uniref:ATP-binding SpoIIE family protein phosphatase n=1 Tax=Pleionea sp. CnH1-48 TaxID=2954494 RepID=UPI0020983F57|nr:fused response regulator/phosphatase [Pleionea sp. CnH1-48]MCO7226112.1 fused response regulator/phosphatase [Pleionea sp. CnH1-48]
MKILIAEDNFTDRLILKKIVEASGHEVLEADNGVTAMEVFVSQSPDLVFLDAIMPEMDGYQAAEKIKALTTNHYVPIIFITSLTEQADLVRCMEVGGDDFFTKPFNKVFLEAKLRAFERTNNLYRTIEKQRDEIQFHTDHMLQEQEVAKRIFDKIAHTGELHQPYIRYTASPMSIFNGDILLVARRPFGGVHVFLGDFTGHGLPAAIGAMPTSDIFFGMTLKGFALVEIIQELNRRLHAVLPTGFFCCALAAHIDFEEHNIQVWNAGLPEAYLMNRASGEFIELPSSHLPLGIVGNENLNVSFSIYSFQEDDRLFAYTDGVTEAENSEGEMFGQERLLEALKRGINDDDAFGCLLRDVDEFQTEPEQGDDITYIEVHYSTDYKGPEDEQNLTGELSSGPSDSRFSLELGPNSLRNFNPLPVLSQPLMEIGHLQMFRTQVLTILTELYSNALEHGVLKLKSSLKSSAEGFAEYYRLRQLRLEELEEGFVKVDVKHSPSDNGGRLEIQVSDSGEGFDYKKALKKAESKGYSGRGFPLLYRLADSVEFENNGATIKVVFSWSTGK